MLYSTSVISYISSWFIDIEIYRSDFLVLGLLFVVFFQWYCHLHPPASLSSSASILSFMLGNLKSSSAPHAQTWTRRPVNKWDSPDQIWAKSFPKTWRLWGFGGGIPLLNYHFKVTKRVGLDGFSQHHQPALVTLGWFCWSWPWICDLTNAWKKFPNIPFPKWW